MIYRKANDSAPLKIATISSKYTRYEDKNPVEGVTNTYFVFGYSSKFKVYGDGSNTGVSIKVKKRVTPTPEPTSKQAITTMIIIMGTMTMILTAR